MELPVGWLLAATLLLASAAGAQPVATAGWNDAVEAAWQRARDRNDRIGRLARAEAQQAAARVPWAGSPAIELEQRAGNGPGGSRRETEVGVTWPLWLPGQRAAGERAGDAEVQAARAAMAAARWTIAGEVHQAGSALLAQQADARQAELQVRLLRALADDVDRRVAAGDLARADAMAARAELLQAEVSHQDARQRVRLAEDHWQILAGLTPVPAEVVAAVPAAASDHPLLVEATTGIERARRQLDVAEKSRRDPPEVGVRLRRETEPAGAATSAALALRVPFAAAGANTMRLAQARAEFDIAVAEEQRVRDRLEIETRSARMQVESAQQQLEFERARAGLLRQRAELIDRSFRAGNTALPELLRALAVAAQADAGVVRQQSALRQAQARLLHTLGTLP